MSELSERGAPGKAKKMIKVFEGTPAGGDKITLEGLKNKPGQRPGEAKKLIKVYEEKKVALDIKPDERKKRVLIVYAHPEEKSFNGAMYQTAKKTFSDLGYEVSVSNLYAMKFNPVAGKGDVVARSESKPTEPSVKPAAKQQPKEAEKPKTDEKAKEKPAEPKAVDASKKDGKDKEPEKKPTGDKPADAKKGDEKKPETKPAGDQKPPEKAKDKEEPKKDDKKTEAKPDDKKPEAKSAEKKDEKKADPKADEKKGETKPGEKKPDAKPAEKKPDSKPDQRKPSSSKQSSGESDRFRYNDEMQLAYDEGRLAQDIVKEQQKVAYADLIIFQFPLHWGSFPAIMKGWMDRVLSQGFAFGPHCYDKGNLKGKVVLSFSARDPETTFTPIGAHGDIGIFLWPMQYGILRYCGFDILSPQICYSPTSANTDSYLKSWATRLKSIITERPIRFIPIENFDEAKGFQLEDKMLKMEAAKSTIGLTTGQHLGKPLPPNFMTTEPSMPKK